MPHFVIDCSPSILEQQDWQTILSTVHDTADASGLFRPGDIKVRVRPYEFATVGNQPGEFLHVFGYIMQGRTLEQRASLSQAIIRELKALFPDVPIVSMNVMEFEKATYCNRNLI